MHNLVQGLQIRGQIEANSWFTQVMEKLENLEKSWKKILSGKVMEMSWKNDLILEK